MIEIKLDGKVVSRSQNLRGILDYAGKRHGLSGYVFSVAIECLPDGKGKLAMTWSGGATAETEFADFTALCEWLAKRHSWFGANLIHAGRTWALDARILHRFARAKRAE